MVYRSANWCLMVYRSASWCLVTCYSTPWSNNLPSSTPVLSIWSVSVETMKINEISSNLQYPKNHQIGAPRPLKVSKMRSKQVPEIIKFMKTSKKWNLMKTSIFTILLRGWDIRNHKIFHLKIIKNHACSPNLFFDASNDRKYQKVIKLVSKWGTQNTWKIIKNPPWDLPGSLCVHLWPTWLQNGAKMVPKDLQMDPKWSSGDPKSS